MPNLQACSKCAAAECSTPNHCNPTAVVGCNVCPHCCAASYSEPAACDSCVFDHCQSTDRRCELESYFDCGQHTPNATCSERCITKCWARPWSPCLQNCSFCKAEKLTFIVLLPFIGRALIGWMSEAFIKKLKAFIKKRCACCKPSTTTHSRALGQPGPESLGLGLLSRESHQQQWNENTTPANGFTVRMLINSGSSWAKALEANGQSPYGATVAAATKLLLWHWLQPVLYFVVFVCLWDDLDIWQILFGSVVAVREALYVLTTLAELRYNPAFLLVDVGASVRDRDSDLGGYTFLGMYVLAPEKFVAMAAFEEGGGDKECVAKVIVFGGVLFDLCGVAALVAGLLSPNGLEPALAIGYSATALGGLFVIGWFVPAMCDPE